MVDRSDQTEAGLDLGSAQTPGGRSDRSAVERRKEHLPAGDKDTEAGRLGRAPSSGGGTAAAPGPRISAEYNPRGGEYGASEHGGPAGTEKAVGPAQHEARSSRPPSNAAAQHDDAAQPGAGHPTRPQQAPGSPSAAADAASEGDSASSHADAGEPSQEHQGGRPSRPVQRGADGP
ncbi:MAG TPA: hypothetical protein VH916_12285 [Dehalococcoidia bacterium]|jgi:hypothetical protein